MEKFLDIGEIIVTTTGRISTTTNKNVALFLWDRKSNTCGACNFSTPTVYTKSLATALYGNVAIPKLISLMRSVVGPTFLDVYLFGGAAVDDNDLVGAENIRIAQTVLHHHLIPVTSEGVGGRVTRDIRFDVPSGECAIIKRHCKNRT